MSLLQLTTKLPTRLLRFDPDKLEPEPPGLNHDEDGGAVPDGCDLGRADIFLERFGDVVRHVHEWNRWLVFEDGRWNADNNGAAHRLAQQLCREIVSEANALAGSKEREAALKDAMEWGKGRAVDALLEATRHNLSVIVRPDELDADPWLVGAKNGVCDLRTGEIFEHSREQLITRCVGAKFDPSATCPRWEKFLAEILPDEDVRRYVWKAAGYSLSGQTTEHAFWFLHGCGANGKSTFLEILFAAFGDYAGRAGSRLLYAQDHRATPGHEIAELYGRRLVIGSETQEGARMNEGAIKDVSGGDTLRGERKYEHGFTFSSTAKLWLAGNHEPTIRGTDDGIWRRVRLIPFERKFGPGERDDRLGEKLRSELPGILNWLMQGALLWQREGLIPPEIVRAAVADYRSDEDVLGDFLAEHVTREPSASVRHAEVFAVYQAWTRAEGIAHPFTSKGLAKRLRERGYRDARTSEAKCVWQGIRLNNQ